MEVDKLTQLIRNKIRAGEGDCLTLLNMPELSACPTITQNAVESLIEDYSIRIRTGRHETASNNALTKLRDLGNMNQRLDKRLQAHIQMLRQNEGSLAGTTDVLEFDSAKSRSDKLIEVVNAKNTWAATLQVVDMMDETEQNDLYNHLVILQQANEILARYVPCNKREQVLESRKDSFFGWFSSAISFAIDTNDMNQLSSLGEKYDALGRSADYKKTFGSYIKNKICSYMNGNESELTLWNLLSEWFSIWKRIYKLADQLLGEKGSEFVALSCYEGIRSKDDQISELLNKLMQNATDTFAAAHELANIRHDFLEYVKSEGDSSVLLIANRICDDLYEMISDDYAKQVKATLFTKINKIAQTANKNTQKHDWVHPLLEEVHAALRNAVNEAASTFGVNFAKYVVPSFEKAVVQLKSTFRDSQVLSTRRSINGTTSLDEMNDKLTCICTAGYLVNIISDTNTFIHETHVSLRSSTATREPELIKNINVLEKLAKKKKVNELAAALIDPMTAEMTALKQAATASDSMDILKMSLPSFSITAHNYITAVGHGLLNHMNNIAAYNTDRNFRTAIFVAAGEKFNEDECDLWILRGIAALLMARYVQNVGEASKLPLKVAKQFHADTVFLMEALQDLRLEPTSNLTALSDELASVAATRS
ncbi:Component of oligomeric Golgi complex 7 [Aphelenchoides besseyi]|nr:Component of oligomeric Golgi complex 7 [Aphelenchoides besseyi]